jgi:thioredoxin-disulfide reductase
MAEDIYDLIIIGAGPAGITAGIYARREKLKTLLIAKGFGGQVSRKAVAIENYPGFKEISGMELIQKFKDHLKKFNPDIEQGEVRKIKKTKENFIVATKAKKQFESRAVIITSGADPRLIEVPGEKEFIGRGVSYCTICDAPMFQDKMVAVIGGGNAGFEAALALSNYAPKIYILEYAREIKADAINQEKVRATGKIEIITNAILKKIQGENFVDSIIYQDRESKQTKTLKCAGVFIEIGSQPATSFVHKLVDFNEKDEIKINPGTCETKTSGLFAAGDVTDTAVKQIVVAASEGAKAAIFASKYLLQ